MELTAYSVQLRKTVDILNPKLVTMKNGRQAVRGVAAEDPTSKVFRILGKDEIEDVRKLIS